MLTKRPKSDWADAVMREREAVYRYAYSRLGPELADEILASTLAAAWSSRRSFRGSGAEELRAWLLGIATNMIRRHWDAERLWIALRSQVASEREEAPDPFDSSIDRMHARQTRSRLVALLDTLDPMDRDLLVLSVVHELDYEALSLALGIPVGTVKPRLSRAKSKLREKAQIINQAGVHHG